MTAVDDRDTFLVEADSYLAQGRYGEALALSQEQLGRCPGDGEAMAIACRCWLGLGRTEEAEATLAGLLPLERRLADLYSALGEAALETQEKGRAVVFFRKALNLISETSPALDEHRLARLAELPLTSQEVPPADRGDVQHKEGSATLGRDFCTMTAADLCVKQGHLHQAVDILETILDRDPDNGDAVQRLRGVKALMSGQGVETASTMPDVVEELNRWLLRLGRLRESNGGNRLRA